VIDFLAAVDPQDVWSFQLPTFTGWIFYVSNMIIVSGYLFASVLIIRRKGVAKDMSNRAWIAGLSFFLLCGLTHVELAIHAFFNLRVINVDGTVDWHMLAIHIPQGASIWAFLWSMQTPGAAGTVPEGTVAPVPLEGAAVDPEPSSNEEGPPHSFPYDPGNPEGTAR
jgi:hypothetical protein